MEYRRLGSTGIEVSCLSLGGWATFGDKVGRSDTVNLLAAAYDAGINFFDNAETYGDGGSESVVGEALRGLRWPRETFLLSSKVFWGVHGKRPNTWGLTRKHIVEACDGALRRYGVDYLDFFLCHRHDPAVSLPEVCRAMGDLVRQGKILYWGTSEWQEEQIGMACDLSAQLLSAPPQIEQMQYSLLAPRRAAVAARSLAKRGIGMTTWSPLAHGLLAGRASDESCRVFGSTYGWLRENVFQPDRETVMRRIHAFEGVARESGVAPNLLALAWVLRNRDICTAITGASSVAQLLSSVAAIDSLAALPDDIGQRLDALAGMHDVDSQ